MNEHYKQAYIKVQRDRQKLMNQNKRYREAIDYVMETETRHYSNMQELLGDIKFVINKTLEES